MPTLSVVIPAYNESALIKDVLGNVIQSLDNNNITNEIIIIDDSSKDDTIEQVQAFIADNPQQNIQLITCKPNRGKGYAIRQGISKAIGDFVIIQDADHEYDPREYPKLLAPLLENKADVVFGSRFAGGNPHRILFFWHSIGNKLLTFISNAFANLNLTDMETGYKAFRTAVVQQLTLHENRFGIEPEITAKIAQLPGVRIYEVGISYHGRTYEEGKKINWKDGFRAIWCILKYNLPHRLKQVSLGWTMLLLLGLVFGYFSFKSQDSYGGGDNIHHFRIARYAFHYPEFFLDQWGKPVFTLLASPFAQFGYNGVNLYNLLAALLTAFFAWRIALYHRLNNSWMIIPFLFFAPVFASMIPGAMTEVTGAMLLTIAIFLYFNKKFIWAAIAISFLPFARTEGMFILPLFGFMFLLRRQWAAIPFLLTAFLIYSVVGGIYFNDFAWVVKQFPYSAKSADIYGRGSLWFYVDKQYRHILWGAPLAFLFATGFMVHLYELIRTRLSLRHEHIDVFVILFMPVIIIVGFHSLAWYLGTGALALTRFMALIIPPFVFFSLKGYSFIEKWLSFNQVYLKILFKLIILYLIVDSTLEARKLPIPIQPNKAVVKEACSFITDNELDRRMIYFYDANVFFLLDINPHDRSRIRERIPDGENPGNGMKPGEIVVWDAHFGPNEGRLPLNSLLEHDQFKILGVFRPKHPFTVLGGYDYEVYIFEYQGDDDQ
jgi:glycosyltransferase involved in cell wall biosynthesis